MGRVFRYIPDEKSGDAATTTNANPFSLEK